MDKVLTLIAPAGSGLDDAIVDQVRGALKTLGADTLSPDWLEPGRACDVPFDGIPLEVADAAARTGLGGAPVDIAAQTLADRRKVLLLADMDSTMVTGETLDELADFAGLKEHIAKITARAMNGEMDFQDALRERVGLLKGLDQSMLERTLKRVTPTPGAQVLVATMRAHGAGTVLVSGGFKYFTSRIGTALGFEEDYANELEIKDGKLTGRVLEPILDKDAKLATLMRIAGERRIPLRLTMTVGDGANDLPMLSAAGAGVAFHAKPTVAAQSKLRIDHGDLTALLFLQGYRREEFAAQA